jgi:hypothetical protein
VSRLKADVEVHTWLVLVLALLVVSLPVAAQDEEVDEELAELTEQARADLAAKLEITVDEVEVASVRRVTWRSSSCGCPKKGEKYLQVLTPGALILLRSGDEKYRYHSSMAGPPFHCKDPAPNDPLPDDSAA